MKKRWVIILSLGFLLTNCTTHKSLATQAQARTMVTNQEEMTENMERFNKERVQHAAQLMNLSGAWHPSIFTTSSAQLRYVDPHCRYFRAALNRKTLGVGRCSHGPEQIIDPKTGTPYVIKFINGKHSKIVIESEQR